MDALPKDVVVVVRWIARVGSVVSVAFLLLFLSDFHPSDVRAREWVGLAFFPVGVVAGMAWGWADEFRGGLLTVVSLAGIYLYLALSSGGPPRGAWFAVFSLPGLLFFLLGLVQRLAGSRHVPTS